MPHTNQFKSTINNKTFKLLNNANCSLSNLVYVITCSLCNIQYVGKTGDTLRNRMNRHRCNIDINQNTAVAIHFKSNNHNLEYLAVTPVELIFYDGKIQRLNREFT